METDPMEKEKGDALPSESVYRDAVTKLRILLHATESANKEDLDSTRDLGLLSPTPDPGADAGQPRGRLGDSAEQVHLVRHKRLSHRHGSNIRAMPSMLGPRHHDRSHSWHNLAYKTSIPDQDDAAVKEDSTIFVDRLRHVIVKQEDYIGQLEKETQFCRDQLSKVLNQVQAKVLPQPTVEATEAAESLKTFQDMIANYANLTHSEEVTRLKLENAMLRQRLDSESETPSWLVIQKLRKDNEILVKSLSQLKRDVDENVRRESEAVEQLKRSLQVAEQARLEKTELEFELNQMKVQLERQATRIRSLIEEQDEKIQEERQLLDRRHQEQLRVLREQLESQAGDVGRMSAELEREQRLQIELRRQIKDRDEVMQEMQQQSEKRLAHLQLELVNMNTNRQQLDHELNCVRLDLDALRQQSQAEQDRHEAEVDNLRGRISRTEQHLAECRQEVLELAEQKAALERQLNLVKLANKATERIVASSSGHQPTEADPDSRGDDDQRFVMQKLRDLIQRQSRVIAELKSQCLLVTDKLEMSLTCASKDTEQLQQQLQRAVQERQQAVQRCNDLEQQCEEYGKVYERCCRRLEQLEVEHKRLLDQLGRLQADNEALMHAKASLEQQLTKFKPDPLQRQAIIIERVPDSRGQDLSLKSSPNHFRCKR